MLVNIGCGKIWAAPPLWDVPDYRGASIFLTSSLRESSLKFWVLFVLSNSYLPWLTSCHIDLMAFCANYVMIYWTDWATCPELSPWSISHQFCLLWVDSEGPRVDLVDLRFLSLLCIASTLTMGKGNICLKLVETSGNIKIEAGNAWLVISFHSCILSLAS